MYVSTSSSSNALSGRKHPKRLIQALGCGFYRIQSVASGKNVDVRQEGLPLFVGVNFTMVSPQGSLEKDYTIVSPTF
jgi:hypothetical protein